MSWNDNDWNITQKKVLLLFGDILEKRLAEMFMNVTSHGGSVSHIVCNVQSFEHIAFQMRKYIKGNAIGPYTLWGAIFCRNDFTDGIHMRDEGIDGMYMYAVGSFTQKPFLWKKIKI